MLQVAVRAHAGSDTQVNTFHYDLVNAPGEPANEPQTLADRFRDDVMPKLQPLYQPAWTIGPVVVMDVKDPQNPDAPRQEWTSGSALLGTKTAASEFLPRACTVVATVKTDRVGRRATGRVFVGGDYDEADQNNGAWLTTTPTWADVGAYLDAIPRAPDLATGPSQSHAFLCVYSRTNRAQGNSWYSSGVQTITRRTQVKWLRSRET
jgi:hypothetical protein